MATGCAVHMRPGRGQGHNTAKSGRGFSRTLRHQVLPGARPTRSATASVDVCHLRGHELAGVSITFKAPVLAASPNTS